MRTRIYLPPLHWKEKNDFMSTAVFASKSGRDRRREITRAAAGKDIVLRGMQPGEPVVNWGEAPDHVHSPCPNAANYDSERFRAHAGAHLVFNAFWKVQHFCVHQMLMLDPMHQIDLGAIVHLIRAILRKFQECVEIALDKVSLVAKTLRLCFELMLVKRNSPDNQRYFIEHVSL
jgi:hypothetical protein